MGRVRYFRYRQQPAKSGHSQVERSHVESNKLLPKLTLTSNPIRRLCYPSSTCFKLTWLNLPIP